MNTVLYKKLTVSYADELQYQMQHAFTILLQGKLRLNSTVSFQHIKNKTYYELLMNDSNELHIVYLLQNEKYGYEINHTNSEQIKNTLYKLDNIDKPIKTLTAYKLSELIEICNKLSIDIINNETNKSKCKKELYESIIKYL